MNESAHVVEAHDPELIRVLLLHLGKQERSPPEAIFVSLSDLSARWKTSFEDVARALEFLSRRGLIEGPGWHQGEFFLFRKVTVKGRTLAEAIGHPRDWSAIKARYLA
jgi:hypothetical protein